VDEVEHFERSCYSLAMAMGCIASEVGGVGGREAAALETG